VVVGRASPNRRLRGRVEMTTGSSGLQHVPFVTSGHVSPVATARLSTQLRHVARFTPEELWSTEWAAGFAARHCGHLTRVGHLELLLSEGALWAQM
jgi:hypothetical protein